MATTERMASTPGSIALHGDPLRTLDGICHADPLQLRGVDLLVIGVDARRARTKADFVAELDELGRTARDFPVSVPQIIAVIEHAGRREPWTYTMLRRWALSIHRRFQQVRGTDTVVTVLLVDSSTSPALVAKRIGELAQRPPGVNVAAVLSAQEIHNQTITEASTNDFI